MSPNHKSNSDEMQAEYDFSNGVRGKHHEAYRGGTNIILLEPDLVEAFPDSASVNHALRLLVRLSKTKAAIGGRPNKPLEPTKRAHKRTKTKRASRAARG